MQECTHLDHSVTEVKVREHAVGQQVVAVERLTEAAAIHVFKETHVVRRTQQQARKTVETVGTAIACSHEYLRTSDDADEMQMRDETQVDRTWAPRSRCICRGSVIPQVFTWSVQRAAR